MCRIVYWVAPFLPWIGGFKEEGEGLCVVPNFPVTKPPEFLTGLFQLHVDAHGLQLNYRGCRYFQPSGMAHKRAGQTGRDPRLMKIYYDANVLLYYELDDRVGYLLSKGSVRAARVTTV